MPQDPDEIRAARDADDLWFKEKFLPVAVPAAILFVMLVAGWIVLGIAKGTLFVVVLVAVLVGGFFGYRHLRERAERQASAQPYPSPSTGMAPQAAAPHVPTPLKWSPPDKPQVEQASGVSGRRIAFGLVSGILLIGALLLLVWLRGSLEHQPTPQELEAQRQAQLKKDEQFLMNKEAEERRKQEEKDKPTDERADTAAFSLIHKMLKSPDTAKLQDSKIIDRNVPEYIVYYAVDAQNSFGAMLRKHYLVCVRLEKNNRYTYDSDYGIAEYDSRPSSADIAVFKERNGWGKVIEKEPEKSDKTTGK